MDDQRALEQLRRIDHIVVVMMENRSFDHMLGYLSLPRPDGTAGGTDIDGLRGPEQDRNYFNGKDYPIAPMGDRGLTKLQDPCHSGWCVGEQMANAMSGFVANYATTRAHQDPGDVMRYQTGAHVPFYDFLAEEFAVLDRWFCSVPGSTWPNRVSALAGQVDKKDNQFPPLYAERSFVRSLPRNVSWRWYSSDPGSLRLIDDQYRTGYTDNFAYVEKPSFVQPHTFFTDVMAEELPNVSWIDPNFVDLGGLQGADDDHPPTDVMAGQSFLLKIYSVLAASALWRKTMLVIIYDEHGGFYDHFDSTIGLPEQFTSRAQFGHFGPRVPALVVSPLTEPGSAFGSAQNNDARLVYDHTALIKTILLRFASDDTSGLPERVGTSSHLGHTLTAQKPRPWPPVPDETVGRVTLWWADTIALRLVYPLAEAPALAELGVGGGPGLPQRAGQLFWDLINKLKDRLAPKPRREPSAGVVLAEPQELSAGVAAAARVIRASGLPPGQP